MKSVLRLTIQISWTCVGLFCCFMVAQLLWSVISGRILNGAIFREGFIWEVFGACALLIGLFLLGALIYTAWLAVFRFSSVIVSPTVFIVGLIMIAVANDGNRRFVDTFLNPHRGMHPGMPFLGLALTVVVIIGWIKFYRVMPLVLTKVLFPDLSGASRAIL